MITTSKNSILWVFFQNKAQLFESDEKSSILWVMFKKGSNIWLIFTKKVNSSGHIKKGSILQVMLKIFILWVIMKKFFWKKCSILRVKCWKWFSSLSNILKRVQFFESNWIEGFHSVSHIHRKGSILWVIVFQKESYFLKRVKCLESCFVKKIFVSTWKNSNFWVSEKKGSICWVGFNKEFNSSSLIRKKEFNSFESYQKKEFNSLSHIRKKEFNSFSNFFSKNIQFCESNSKKKSILWVIISKNSILWVIFRKSSILWVKFNKSSFLGVKFWNRVHFLESYLNKKSDSLRHIQQKRFQFYASYSRKKSSILWSYSKKKGWILWVVFKKKKFNSGSRKNFSWSHIWKRVQFFSTFWTNGPILCVIFKKFNCSIHCVIFKK